MLGLIIPALIANDFEIQDIGKTLLGLFVVVGIVFVIIYLVMFI